MKADLEKATKASQCAALLCDDLRDLVSTENILLSDIALNHLAIAAKLDADLDHLVSSLAQMKEKL